MAAGRGVWPFLFPVPVGLRSARARLRVCAAFCLRGSFCAWVVRLSGVVLPRLCALFPCGCFGWGCRSAVSVPVGRLGLPPACVFLARSVPPVSLWPTSLRCRARLCAACACSFVVFRVCASSVALRFSVACLSEVLCPALAVVCVCLLPRVLCACVCVSPCARLCSLRVGRCWPPRLHYPDGFCGLPCRC